MDEKHAEAKLRESEKRHRIVLEHVSDIIFQLTPTGFIQYVSPNTENILGYSPGELIGCHLKKTTPLNEVPKALKTLKRVISGEEVRNFEIMQRRADGHVIPVEINLTPLITDGRTTGLQGMMRNATERKLAEKALKEAEELYRTIIDAGSTAKEGFALIQDIDGIEGKHVFVNDYYAELLGYSKEELYTVSCFDQIVVEERDGVRDRYRRKMAGEDLPKYHEMEWERKDGLRLTIGLSSAVASFKGKPAFLYYFRDITEEKQAEDAIKEMNRELFSVQEELYQLNENLEEKVAMRTAEVEKLLKQKEEFISQLGYDIKTPLTPLLALLPVIERKESDPNLKELAEICLRNTNFIKNLVVATLKLAKLNSEGAVFDLKEVNLLDLVNSIIKDEKTIFTDKAISIEKEIDERVVLEADELQLHEVLNNLISNAVKFMDNGGTVRFFTEAGEEHGFVQIGVKDTGIGMTDEQMPHLFEEFYKADSSRHEFASSGLGLTISKRIVEKHGGKIWAESEGEGEGTTFYFTMPMVGG